MNYPRQMDLSPLGRTAAVALPPPLIEETAWDILLALHSDERCNLSLGQLGSVVSVPQATLKQWLAILERQGLITGAKCDVTQELRAVLRSAGREMLDRYLSVTSVLQIGAHH